MTAESVVACAAVAAVLGTDILLVRRANPPETGKLTLPGGRLRPGESPADAGRRELQEETGLRVSRLAFLGHHVYVNEGYSYLTVVYLGRFNGPPRSIPSAGDDALEADWRSFSSWPALAVECTSIVPFALDLAHRSLDPTARIARSSSRRDSE